MSSEEKFLAAVNVIENLPSDGTFQPSEDLMLKLFAYYMQATQGPCRMAKPFIWHYSSRIKWSAWNDLGYMDRETAMEKYVEELTKVIETMSYNENVSRFMSLIGPFYEVVSSEEVDGLPEKGLEKKNITEYSCPEKKLEIMHSVKIDQSPKMPGSNDFSLHLSKNPTIEIEKLHKHHFIRGNTKYIPSQDVIDIFKAKVHLKHPPFGSHQDMLILTIINLQNSLEEIVKKFDNLNLLAKSADFKSEINNEHHQTGKELNLGYSSTALAVLWPIALHLLMRS